jgi:hypothetical protein
MRSDGRSYVPAYFALDLDGVKCGLIQKVEGGDVEGEVTNLPIGHVKYNDFTVQMGLSMGQPLKDWIEASLNMNYMRKSGELKTADFTRKVRDIRVFEDALLTEIGFPGLDGSSKDPAFMSLTFSPWIVRNKKGDGSKIEDPADMEQKMWTPSNFRLTIEGLEEACVKVQKVEAITIKQAVVRDHSAQVRDDRQEPRQVGFPNLKLTLREADAEKFFAWHKDFVINGNNGEEKHKSGSLEYLNQNRQKVLLTLEFSGLGISRISAQPLANNEDKIASVTVELYGENITGKFA